MSAGDVSRKSLFFCKYIVSNPTYDGDAHKADSFLIKDSLLRKGLDPKINMWG